MEKTRFLLPLIFLVGVISILFGFYAIKLNYDDTPTLNILMLHMVTSEMPEDESLKDLYITDDMLRRYCEYFKDKYQIVSLGEGYDIIKNNKPVDNPNLLAFTFDDGYDNNYYLAYPILRELGIKANINIIAKYTDENYPGYLTWEQVKEMSDSGLISIGSHTYNSHFYTTDNFGKETPVLAAVLPSESGENRKKRIFSDLERADKMISNVIGKEVEIFAYPYGVCPVELVEEIRDKFGYNIQLLVKSGVNRGADKFIKLNRFCVIGTQPPEELDRLIKRYSFLKFFEN